MARARGTVRWLSALVVGVLASPTLWIVSVRQAARLVRSGWWRERPFLPRPGSGYLAFRSSTAYGSGDQRPPVEDVLDYLRWCRA